MRASLRDLRSPRKNYKSTIEDDLKKLIIMDNLAPEQERDARVRRGCPAPAPPTHTHNQTGWWGEEDCLCLPTASARGTCRPVWVCGSAARSQDVELVRGRITA